ncbi:MAG: type II secretion system major pseudopilin GspG [Dokdonella sp.]|uniref:type II secretion system major pseudopilin GspG n=1 Tax=Dokdonella sp. TaxID=2291710 RepID=UPI0025C36F5F|nr:type II secretion system major pseudopilin GspG [Dokdonella sp.]MBZ0224346.1 type II secretion system major pseudopilin GspG [Dokdonella sp.]MCC7254792.1 type II secretion system major pseudopilin GspG [Dokdonella sp.]
MRRNRHCKAHAADNRGFTLIEILVVVVILGILAAIVVPKVMDRPGEARIVKAHQDISSIGSALNLYKLDNYAYPSTEQGLEALIAKPTGQPEAANWKGPYLQARSVPKDPWGRPYQYASPGQHGDFDISSFGADGKPGGEGEAADVDNRN